MSRAKKATPTPPTGHKAEIIKLMHGMAHRHDLWRVFSDFVEMAAVSIANACDQANRDREAREARYLEIAKAYGRDELEDFAHMLGHLTLALEFQPGDVLGEVFMEMDLGSKWHGQFFTPYPVCRMMAALTLGTPDALRAKIEAQGFVTVNEPACGGGAMLIAMAEEMRDAGVNYQQHMHCTAQDLDLKAVHMAYVQLSLLHVPAYVVHGNSLAVEQRSLWCTPAHIMGGWTWKLRRRRDKPEEPPAKTEEVARALPPPSEWQQAGLF